MTALPTEGFIVIGVQQEHAAAQQAQLRGKVVLCLAVVLVVGLFLPIITVPVGFVLALTLFRGQSQIQLGMAAFSVGIGLLMPLLTWMGLGPSL